MANNSNGDWRKGFIGSESEAVRTGLNAVKKVTGFLKIPSLEPGKDWGDGKKKVERLHLTIADAKILEMDKGVPTPELENDEYHIWMPYAPKGELPTKQAKVTKSIIKSGKELWEKRGQKDKDWRDLVEGVVTLERRDITYTFTDKAKEEGGEKAKRKENVDGWFFVENGEAEPADIRDAILAKVVGQKYATVKRTFAMDALVRRHPEYKEALTRNDGTFEKLLGVRLDDDGSYVLATDDIAGEPEPVTADAS